MGWPQVQFRSKFLKYSINHLTVWPLGLAIEILIIYLACWQISTFLMGKSCMILRLFLKNSDQNYVWTDNRHVFNSYFISQYVRFVILCALYASERPISLVFFLKKCIKARNGHNKGKSHRFISIILQISCSSFRFP